MENSSLNANLIKKYHQDIVFNYSEYPTLDHWSPDYRSEDYKKSLKIKYCYTCFYMSYFNIIDNLNNKYKTEGYLTLEDFDKKNETGTNVLISLIRSA